MGVDQLAGPCTDDVGIANSIGALWVLGGGAWVICVVDCCGWLSRGNLFYIKYTKSPQIKQVTSRQTTTTINNTDHPCTRSPMHHHPTTTEHQWNWRRPHHRCTVQLAGHSPCKTWPAKLRETGVDILAAESSRILHRSPCL